jgi:hypothetical protein
VVQHLGQLIGLLREPRAETLVLMLQLE